MKVTITSFIIAGICILALFVILSLSILFDFYINYKINLSVFAIAMFSVAFGVLWSYILLDKEMGKSYKARRELHKEVRKLGNTMSELNKVRGELRGSVAKLD